MAAAAGGNVVLTKSARVQQGAAWDGGPVTIDGRLVGVPALAVLLVITSLGIPLGIAAFALYPLLLLMGCLTGALFVAQRAGHALRPSGAQATFGSTIGLIALAPLILMLIGHLPAVGPLTVLVTPVLGLGACVIEWYRRRQVPPAAPA